MDRGELSLSLRVTEFSNGTAIDCTLHPVSEQYVTVSQKLVTKFPNLRDPIGTNGFVGVISDSICFHTCNFV